MDGFAQAVGLKRGFPKTDPETATKTKKRFGKDFDFIFPPPYLAILSNLTEKSRDDGKYVFCVENLPHPTFTVFI
jgi:hypothetical protein